MGCRRTFVAAGVLATIFAVGANAADMPGTYAPPPLVTRTPSPLEKLTAGWYLRGDLGVSAGRLTKAESVPGFTSPTDSTLGNGITAGGGIGIKSEWLRTDITADYNSPLKYSGTIAAPGDVTAKIQFTSLLFNGYIDIGTWYGLTPYIGAGIGTSYVRVTDYISALAPPFGGDTAHSQWTLSYAAMAGVGWAVAPNLMLDFGYRYLNVGDMRTNADAFGAMTFKNVAAHELRVGLRWSFNDIRGYH